MKTAEKHLARYEHHISSTQLMNPEVMDSAPASLVVEMLQRAQLPTQWGNKTIFTLSHGEQTIEVAANGDLTSPTGEISKIDAEEALHQASGAIFYQLARAGRLTDNDLKTAKSNGVSTLATSPEGNPILYFVNYGSDIHAAIKLTLPQSTLPEDPEMQEQMIEDWTTEISALLASPDTMSSTSPVMDIVIRNFPENTSRRDKNPHAGSLEASIKVPKLLGERQTLTFEPIVDKNYGHYSEEEEMLINLTDTAPQEALKHLSLFDPRGGGKIDITTRRGAKILFDLFFAVDKGEINWGDFTREETQEVANRIKKLMPVVYTLLKVAVENTGPIEKINAAHYANSSPEAIRRMLIVAIEGYGRLGQREGIYELFEDVGRFFQDTIPLAHAVDKRNNEDYHYEQNQTSLTREDTHKMNRAENILTNLMYRLLMVIPIADGIDKRANMPMLSATELYTVFGIMLSEGNELSIQNQEVKQQLAEIYESIEQKRATQRLIERLARIFKNSN